jgi:hypothetical protein
MYCMLHAENYQHWRQPTSEWIKRLNAVQNLKPYRYPTLWWLLFITSPCVKHYWQQHVFESDIESFSFTLIHTSCYCTNNKTSESNFLRNPNYNGSIIISQTIVPTIFCYCTHYLNSVSKLQYTSL